MSASVMDASVFDMCETRACLAGSKQLSSRDMRGEDVTGIFRKCHKCATQDIARMLLCVLQMNEHKRVRPIRLNVLQARH
jgi:hypothetical protein